MIYNTNITNLNSLLKFLKRNIYSFKISLFFFIFISFTYILLSDTYYESTITLYPAGELHDSYDSLFEQYEAISDAFGLNTNSKSNYYIPDIIVSNNLKKKIVENKWSTYKSDNLITLIDYWKINDVSIFDNIKKIFKSDFYDREVDNTNTAIEILDDLIVVDEKNSGLIEFTVYMQEPKLAQDIALFISDYVVTFVEDQQRSFARKNKVFIDAELEEADQKLKDSENLLTIFRKKHAASLDTPELKLERLQLIRNVQIKQSVLETLTKQQVIAKLEEAKERLFINILSEATYNVEKTHPKIIIIFISSLVFGFVITFLVLISFANIKASLDD